VPEDILKNKLDSHKDIFFIHSLVIFIFFILTIILTFPVIFDFNSELAGEGCHDKCHMMWRIWWADYSIENNLDFLNTDYIFYPDGTSIGGNLALFTTGLGLMIFKLTNNLISVYNTVIFIGFVFGGYSAYLLANHFNRNLYSSIIAGVVFTFSTYHLTHSGHHIGLSMIGWIPLYILFLFKIQSKHSTLYSIFGGIILFLVGITHLYYFVMVMIFSFVFLGVFLLKKKDVSNKIFIKQFSIIMVIGIILTVSFSYSTFFSDEEFETNPLWQHEMFSVSIENLIMPSPKHTTQIYSDYELLHGFHALAGSPDVGIRSVEQVVYLGYAAIILATIALIKFRRQYAWFWASVGGLFLLISLGPELRFFNNLTGIILPERLLYEFVPGWDSIRAPARFIVITNISLAILSSYTVYSIMKKSVFSNKVKYVIFSIIIVAILIDFSFSPMDTNEIDVPEIYNEIKLDSSEFSILELPLGGYGENNLISAPIFMYFQTIHEKPIIGGYESRPSKDLLENQSSYFLNIFHYSVREAMERADRDGGIRYESENERMEKYLDNSALSDMKTLGIKYVIIHKSTLFDDIEKSRLYSDKFHQEKYVPKVNEIMLKILDMEKPYFEDKDLIVHKIIEN
tara:strand:+ start:135 stop:2012 length:1878 start_codon:yes stop_codon:yes gene_type:complete